MLSKSSVLKSLQCEKALWLSKNRRDLILPGNPAREKLFDMGRRVGELARTLYPGGVLIGNEKGLKDSLAQTVIHLKTAPALFEATLAADGCLIRADVLERVAGGWDLIEVKMSTQPDEQHLIDIAIQCAVARKAGLKVRRAYLMLIDNTYVRDGEIDPEKLFQTFDVTSTIRPYQRKAAGWIRDFQKMVAAKTPPDIAIGPHCVSPYACEFESHCWKDIADNSIFRSGLSWVKIQLLESLGIATIDRIPDDFKLSPRQRQQIDVAVNRATIVQRPRIAAWLGGLQDPVHHLDFETIMSPIPLFDDSRPYEQIPFQYSLHVEGTGHVERHEEFLAEPGPDPREAMARSLAESLGATGTVLAWNASFEKRVLSDLAGRFPAYRKRLTSAIDRIQDLMTPFRDRSWCDHRFDGGASLKAVLPVLVPRMSYENLDISNGGEACDAYLALLDGGLSPAAAKKVQKDLLIYCGQDTKAMVEILKVMRKEAESASN